MTHHKFLQVFVTIDDKDKAHGMCRDVVEKRLAACAQVLGPIQSIYWWEGRVEDSPEWLCLMKSRKDLYGRIEETIKSCHPYDEPEILAVPIIAGSPGYLSWINETVTL